GRVCGARVRDVLEGDTFDLMARVVVNATGPGCDVVRRMENPQAAVLVEPSRGTHLALDASWAPLGEGLLIPKTADGRVLFLLPWQGCTIAGTTDIAATPTDHPEPSDAEVDYLLGQLALWLDPAPDRNAVRARWAGLRPLIAADATSTASIVREHQIDIGPKGLVSVAGGKWTTYRLMAEETVDQVIASANLKPHSGCRTRSLALLGAAGFHAELASELATHFSIEADIAQHLAHAYGGRARDVLNAAGAAGKHRLAAGHPYIEAEVAWAREHEMACTADDVLARRTRLAFIDTAAAQAAKVRVEALLAG
ncbi:MAG: FAD-dependent oxidoreductase, partial [Xanthomonadales bacterium]|nr:FAD-dependent oxidoreductase [Xanthomonadales bacterium]